MKGIVCYYSTTGNTRLTVEYLQRHISATTFDLCNIVTDKLPDLQQYDCIGFVTWADFGSPSPLFEKFLAELPLLNNKTGFVMCTYGLFYGGTLRKLYTAVKKKGITIIATGALHTPENIPSMISKGFAMAQAPNTKEFAQFIRFVDTINKNLSTPEKIHPKGLPLLNWILPSMPRKLAKKELGIKLVDTALCVRCGLCSRVCPVKAITMNGYPKFDEDKCSACWSCYNHCPSKAIYTEKFRGKWHYPSPLPQFAKKLSE